MHLGPDRCDERVELAEAVRDAGEKVDDATVAPILVKEVQLFRPGPRQAPQGHFSNNTRQIPHCGCERAIMPRMGFAYQVHDGRLPIGVLLKDGRLARRGVRHHLPPVVSALAHTALQIGAPSPANAPVAPDADFARRPNDAA